MNFCLNYFDEHFVTIFQVSTDDSDSYFSDPDDDYRNHINAPVMSPLEPIYPDADDVTWKRAGKQMPNLYWCIRQF
jgi:hypothetical protein